MHVFEDIATAGFVALLLAVLGSKRGLTSWRLPTLTLAAAFAFYEAFDLARIAASAIRHPPLWDFSVFWMVGRIAASHHNVYDIASYRMYRAILNPTGDVEFNTIALNIGLPYPPPVILLLYPLGLFAKIATALTAWYVAVFGALAAGIVLLWRRFFASQGVAGLIAAALLVLTLSATHMTVGLGQLDFFALLLLLLFWGERIRWRAGLWLAPLIVLRPLCVLLALYFIARREWSALIALVATSVALLAISLPIVGPSAFASYLHHNPTTRYPEIYFVGSQSLYKLLVTFSQHHAGYFSLGSHPLFDIIAVVSIAGAAAICAIARKQQRDASLGLLLALGLFLYPNTDTHYCSLLLVPLCALWRHRDHFGLSANAVAVIFFIQYLLLDVRAGAATTGLLLALDSVFFGLLALRRSAASTSLRRRTAQTSFAAGGSIV